MKVIFLDIDGVLNCAGTTDRWPKNSGMLGIEPAKVKIFNNILRRTDARVVLSSTWRHDDDWLRTMKANGLHSRYFIDRTPRMPLMGGAEMMERGKEIQAWLDKHPEVTKYAIIDDDSDMLPEQPLFKTSWQTGLTHKIADQVIKHLKS